MFYYRISTTTNTTATSGGEITFPHGTLEDVCCVLLFTQQPSAPGVIYLFIYILDPTHQSN